MARRWPRLTSPAAGGWMLPGAGIRRPVSVPLEQFGQVVTQQIRPGEGSASAVIPASGQITILLGPEGLAVWALSYVAISTTTGAGDTSVAYVATGPAPGAGIVPAGTAYNGGGDTVSLGGAVLQCGEYVSVTWQQANPGDQAIARVYGNQQVLA